MHVLDLKPNIIYIVHTKHLFLPISLLFSPLRKVNRKILLDFPYHFLLINFVICLVIVSGFAVGKKNWVRITFAIEQPSLEDGLGRIKDFYQRHAK